MNNITQNKQVKNDFCSTEKCAYKMIAQFNIHTKHDTFNNQYYNAINF